jgi:hypothetical protein
MTRRDKERKKRLLRQHIKEGVKVLAITTVFILTPVKTKASQTTLPGKNPDIINRVASIKQKIKELQDSNKEQVPSEQYPRLAQWPNYWRNWPNYWNNYWNNWRNY